HRTLRDTIAWSHDLLTPEERTLFRRLSVFAGGLDLEAAAAVGGNVTPRQHGADVTTQSSVPGTLWVPQSSPIHPVLGIVATLARKSLLRQEPSSTHGALGNRFRMLETIREYALEQLDASSEGLSARRRHAEWFLSLAERAYP